MSGIPIGGEGLIIDLFIHLLYQMVMNIEEDSFIRKCKNYI